MREPLHKLGRLGLAILIISSLFAIAINAQEDSDAKSRNSIAGFVDSIAKLTYKAAWPTATYKTWSFAAPVTDVDGGYDVVIKLSGLSGIDGSDLWLKVGIALRSGGIERFWVVDHNAILMPPFKTAQRLGQITAELAKQYQESQRAQAPRQAPPLLQAPITTPSPRAAAVCVSNGTNYTLKFKYHWGIETSSLETLEPNKAMVYWWPLENQQTSAPIFFIEYDDNFEDGYTPQSYKLGLYSVSLPTSCPAAKRYLFTTDGTKILLRSTN